MINFVTVFICLTEQDISGSVGRYRVCFYCYYIISTTTTTTTTTTTLLLLFLSL